MRPPVVPSAEFDADYAYTLAFGAINSTNRTAYETDTARFWYDEDTGKLLLTVLASISLCFAIMQGVMLECTSAS